MYYRMQWNYYDITKESRSFYSEFCSLEESMQADIDRWLENGEEVEILDSVEDTFNKAIENGLEKYYTEFGVSCYKDTEELIRYWKEIGWTLNDYTAHKDDTYVLAFNGEYTGKGKDGEDTAKFIEEVRRINLIDFVKENKDAIMDIYNTDEEEINELLEVE